jgi:glycyl-tRNA synthetase (class II)
VYCIFEHCFRVRAADAQRTYFIFPPLIAPLKCSILPLIGNNDLNTYVQNISKNWFDSLLILIHNIESTLTRAGVSSKIDDSGQTIGKRYARTDECGIPFAITVDFDTLKDETVTLRDLDSMKQVRMPVSKSLIVLMTSYRSINLLRTLLNCHLVKRNGRMCKKNSQYSKQSSKSDTNYNSFVFSIKHFLTIEFFLL